MDKQELGAYRILKKRIEKLKGEMEELKARDIDVVAGKVKGSMNVHPYTERRFSVEMTVPQEIEKINDAIRKKEKEVADLEERIKGIEQFIGSIKDVHTKSIFEYRYLEGMTQEKVAEKIGLERSSVSKKISSHFKLSHNSQK